MSDQLKDALKSFQQQAQTQRSLEDQLRDLIPFANRLGLYDAADFLAKTAYPQARACPQSPPIQGERMARDGGIELMNAAVAPDPKWFNLETLNRLGDTLQHNKTRLLDDAQKKGTRRIYLTVEERSKEFDQMSALVEQMKTCLTRA